MKLYGKTKDTNGTIGFVVTMAGQTVFDGTVQTTDSDADIFLGESVGLPILVFDFPLSLTGSVPFVLTVQGGSFRWTISETNYHGHKLKVMSVNIVAGVWPNGAPASEEEFIADSQSLLTEDFMAKYGDFPAANLDFDGVVSADNWQDVNGENNYGSDGRDNVMIDGVSYTVDSQSRAANHQMGDIHYSIGNGQTLTCDLVIAPARDIPA